MNMRNKLRRHLLTSRSLSAPHINVSVYNSSVKHVPAARRAQHIGVQSRCTRKD